MGYSMNVGPELEFFLFKLDANGNPTTELTDQGGYFDFAPLTGHRMCAEILTML